jgi:hypothetical protein
MKNVRRLLTGTVAVAATTLGVMVAGTPAAQAHETSLTIKNSSGLVLAVAVVESGHHRALVSASRCPHSAHIDIAFTDGFATRVDDPDGCGNSFIGDQTFQRTIASYRLCIDDNTRCTRFKLA